jgi:glycine dehydrogenase subunit 2
LQDEETIQGILEVMYRFEQMSERNLGHGQVHAQPAAGSAAIYTNVSMIRAFHQLRGSSNCDEVITTIFRIRPMRPAHGLLDSNRHSHPDADGLPGPVALKAAVSSGTAGL